MKKQEQMCLSASRYVCGCVGVYLGRQGGNFHFHSLKKHLSESFDRPTAKLWMGAWEMSHDSIFGKDNHYAD